MLAASPDRSLIGVSPHNPASLGRCDLAPMSGLSWWPFFVHGFRRLPDDREIALSHLSARTYSALLVRCLLRGHRAGDGQATLYSAGFSGVSRVLPGAFGRCSAD